MTTKEKDEPSLPQVQYDPTTQLAKDLHGSISYAQQLCEDLLSLWQREQKNTGNITGPLGSQTVIVLTTLSHICKSISVVTEARIISATPSLTYNSSSTSTTTAIVPKDTDC